MTHGEIRLMRQAAVLSFSILILKFVFFLAENLKDNHENTKVRKHEIQ